MTAKPRYFVAILEKDADSAFGVWFPDVPGAYGAAGAFDDIVTEAGQALRHHVEAMESAGVKAPSPRPYADVMAAADVREAIARGCSAIVVPLLADGGRTVRLNISIDRALVEAIDHAADARGLTRSSFLAQAAREKIMAGAA